MSYDFANLSPIDFEDLVRDLIGQELKIRFEGFSVGPDGGIDGRHAVGGKATILQAKHYAGSSFPSLKRAMKRERASIEKIRPKPRRYILATSRALTPPNKAALTKSIGPLLKRESDIFGPADLNGLLRKFPEVEKANIKLWLSGAAVLERLIRSPAYSFTAMSRADIEAKVAVYAQNPSFKEARNKLEANHGLIISGPPGVGKTTLAEMLSYAYIGEEWEFVAIRSLDDGLAAIIDAKRQIFFFDDFLGTVALDARALAAKDSDLARFIKRIRKSSNARFILTTRAPIFEEARRVSERLGDPALDIVKYVLDVGIYTRRIRARILYNHFFVSGTPKKHITALWASDAIRTIVDHKNYNPRIIEAMTDGLHTRNVLAEAYPTAFLHALDKPHQLWDTAFRTQIPEMCRHLLFSLFFCSEYGAELDELRVAFDALHLAMCKAYNRPHAPKDFEESLKILEGGFISIGGTRVSFINPSVRDYLTNYLDDVALLSLFAASAQKANWAASLWRHVRDTERLATEQHMVIARAFMSVAKTFPRLPVMKPDPKDPSIYRFHDLSLTDRISLLLEWSAISGDNSFENHALAIANDPAGGFSPWRDGVSLIKLIRSLRNGKDANLSCARDLSAKLEEDMIAMFEDHMWPDDLDTMYNAIDDNREVLSNDVFQAANSAVTRGIDYAKLDAIAIDSESTLEDHAKALERLAPRAGISEERLKEAISHIQSRISEINESAGQAPSPDFSGNLPRETDRFDDDALRNLFAPLIAG